jgi:hypothetical protein
MKKLIILIFLLLPLTVMGQSNLRAFLRPVPNDLFKVIETTDQDVRVNQRTYLWLPRPMMNIVAVKWWIDKDTKKIVLTSTPTDENSLINKEYEKGNKSKFHITCPHCGAKQHLEFKNLKYRTLNDEKKKIVEYHVTMSENLWKRIVEAEIYGQVSMDDEV